MTALLLALALSADPAPRVAPLQSVEQVMALPALHAKGTHVVHFWAAWCGPCLEELPGFVKRARALAGDGVDFTFLSVDPADQLQSAVLPALDAAGAFFPGAHHHLLLESIDPDQLTRRFAKDWPGGLPATFVYRAGKQVGDFRGAREAQALEHLGRRAQSR